MGLRTNFFLNPQIAKHDDYEASLNRIVLLERELQQILWFKSYGYILMVLRFKLDQSDYFLIQSSGNLVRKLTLHVSLKSNLEVKLVRQRKFSSSR